MGPAVVAGIIGGLIFAIFEMMAAAVMMGAEAAFKPLRMIALWIVNFFVIAPVAGWNWFSEQTNPIVQVLAHGLFFGLPVGWYLGRTRHIAVPGL